MRINQNIAAFNAYRNLSQTQQAQASSLEKLSSGFRINRAADDAAGLVNSENLRAQIGGLKVATRNAQDAISFVQTAEGAQTEVHSILQRMRDLTVQSGNVGVNDEAALTANQEEITQLKAELNRIAEQTQFGTKQILNGDFALAIATPAVAASPGAAAEDILAEVTGASTNVTGATGGGAVPASTTINFADAALAAEVSALGSRDIIWEFTDSVGGAFTVTSAASDGAAGLRAALTAAAPAGFTVGGTGDDVSLTATTNVAGQTIAATAADSAAVAPTAAQDATYSGGAVFQVGANADQVVRVGVGSVEAARLGTGAAGLVGTWTNVDEIDLTDTSGQTVEQNVSDALKILDDAISTVSSNRAELGAFQNRMESTIRNVSVAVENLSAAESRIRDTDMASEMVSFTRSQILSQAGTAMLAQANQVPQSVLSLLR